MTDDLTPQERKAQKWDVAALQAEVERYREALFRVGRGECLGDDFCCSHTVLSTSHSVACPRFDQWEDRAVKAEAERDEARALLRAAGDVGYVERLTLALRNVRQLAKRLRGTDPGNAAHLLRFCDSVGIVDSFMRGEEVEGG